MGVDILNSDSRQESNELILNLIILIKSNIGNQAAYSNSDNEYSTMFRYVSLHIRDVISVIVLY